jgi:hypothetical protein
VTRLRTLSGLLAFAVCSATPGRAWADGPDVVPTVAPASPAPEAADPSPPPSPAAGGRVAAWVLGGVAIVGAGAGTAFGVLALNDKSSFDSHPTYHAADSANENAVLSDVFFGGAVVAAVTSIVLFVRSADSPRDGAAGSRSPPAAFTVAPVVTSHGGGAGVALRF